MRSRRILGIVLLVAGIAAILFATYIDNQVAEGRIQITEAQQKVDVGTSIFSLTPQTKQATAPITRSVQSRIDQGTLTANQYEILAHGFKIGGIIAAIAGILLIGSSYTRKNKR